MAGSLPLRSRIARRVSGLPLGGSAVKIARVFYGDGKPDEQWQRIVLNRTVREWVSELGPRDLDVLEISGSNWPVDGFFRSHRAVDFPEFDICRDQLDDRFDLVIAEQVFEHIPYPLRAAKNVLEMLRPGGCFLISTPFLIRRHACPLDCSRWTETGMKYLLIESGFPESGIRTGSWGNRRCAKANFRGRWPIYVPGFHSLRNDPDYPLQVWALARKSG